MKSHSSQLLGSKLLGGKVLGVVMPLCLAVLMAAQASAATSFSNSLTSFTGDSTLAATQGALNTAGFNFFSIEGLDEGITRDPSVVFDTTGARFGSLWGGDNGRNYVRTNESDYATTSFVAEISVTYGAGGLVVTNQQAFLGMGTGNFALYGIPDWSTLFASTFVQPENGGLTTFRTQNDANQWAGNPGAAYDAGTHRLQMTFDAVAKTATYAMDVNYAGGPFVADSTTAAVDLNHIDCPSGCGNPPAPISADFFGPDGWPNEPSSIYFGGDDGVIFSDFSVVVSAAPGLDGDFNNDDVVDGRDFLTWQRGGSPQPLTSGDLTLWRDNYGTGTLAAVTSVPEPASLLLLLSMVSGTLLRRRV
jgi:hypothetical protein